MNSEVIITNQDSAMRLIKQMDELICAMAEDLSKVTGLSESDVLKHYQEKLGHDIWHETFAHVVGIRNDDDTLDQKIRLLIAHRKMMTENVLDLIKGD